MINYILPSITFSIKRDGEFIDKPKLHDVMAMVKVLSEMTYANSPRLTLAEEQLLCYESNYSDEASLAPACTRIIKSIGEAITYRTPYMAGYGEAPPFLISGPRSFRPPPFARFNMDISLNHLKYLDELLTKVTMRLRPVDTVIKFNRNRNSKRIGFKVWGFDIDNHTAGEALADTANELYHLGMHNTQYKTDLSFSYGTENLIFDELFTSLNFHKNESNFDGSRFYGYKNLKERQEVRYTYERLNGGEENLSIFIQKN